MYELLSMTSHVPTQETEAASKEQKTKDEQV